MKTGIQELDNMINLEKSNLILLGSRPSKGKSTFVVNIAKNISVNHNISTLFFSLELSKQEVLSRILVNMTSIERERIKAQSLTRDETIIINDNIEKIKKSKLYIYDRPHLTIEEIKSKCIEFKQKNSMELVIIDYLQLIKQYNNETLKQLKELANELNIAIIVTSQLTRKIEERRNKRPLISDVKNIKYADIILLLYVDFYYNFEKAQREDEIEIIIVKNRNDIIKTINLDYIGKYARFTDKKDYIE